EERACNNERRRPLALAQVADSILMPLQRSLEARRPFFDHPQRGNVPAETRAVIHDYLSLEVLGSQILDAQLVRGEPLHDLRRAPDPPPIGDDGRLVPRVANMAF